MSALPVSSIACGSGARGALGLLLAAGLLALPSVARAKTKTIDVPGRAQVVLEGERSGDLTGSSVASAGDVNGDGHADVIVGAPLADPRGRQDAGSAYVVFGGGPRGRVQLGELGARGFRVDGAITAPALAHHPDRRRGAGGAVDGAGDVNGDGLDDLLISAPHAVFIVFGKRDSAPVDLAALGNGGYTIGMGDSPALEESDVNTAWAVGDVNADGRGDIAVNLYFPYSEQSGTLAIVNGKSDAAPVAIDPDAPMNWGRLVHLRDYPSHATAAADVNHDGVGDMLIGTPGADTRKTGSGAVFMLYGRRTTGDTIQIASGQRFDGVQIRHPDGAFGFGWSLTRLGRGFVAGAPSGPRGRLTGRGGAWIIARLGAHPTALTGPRNQGPIGATVDVPGDINGDHRRDILAITHGRANGPATGLLFTTTGRRIASYHGLRNAHDARAQAAGAGDTGGSQRADLIFGSPGANRAYMLISR